LHTGGGHNLFLVFKSFEIILFEDGKTHNPLYVPVTAIEQLMCLNLRELEMKIVQNIQYQQKTNTFSYVEKA